MTTPTVTLHRYNNTALNTMADQDVIWNRIVQHHDESGTLEVTMTNAIIGMNDEVSELLELAINWYFFGVDPEVVTKLTEELGDVLWRIRQLCELESLSFMTVIQDAMIQTPMITLYGTTPPTNTEFLSSIAILCQDISGLNKFRKRWIEYGKDHIDYDELHKCLVSIVVNIRNILHKFDSEDYSCNLFTCLQANLDKLQKGRYKDGYSDHNAADENRPRDLEASLVGQSVQPTEAPEQMECDNNGFIQPPETRMMEVVAVEPSNAEPETGMQQSSNNNYSECSVCHKDRVHKNSKIGICTGCFRRMPPAKRASIMERS